MNLEYFKDVLNNILQIGIVGVGIILFILVFGCGFIAGLSTILIWALNQLGIMHIAWTWTNFLAVMILVFVLMMIFGGAKYKGG